MDLTCSEKPVSDTLGKRRKIVTSKSKTKARKRKRKKARDRNRVRDIPAL